MPPDTDPYRREPSLKSGAYSWVFASLFRYLTTSIPSSIARHSFGDEERCTVNHARESRNSTTSPVTELRYGTLFWRSNVGRRGKTDIRIEQDSRAAFVQSMGRTH